MSKTKHNLNQTEKFLRRQQAAKPKTAPRYDRLITTARGETLLAVGGGMVATPKAVNALRAAMRKP